MSPIRFTTKLMTTHRYLQTSIETVPSPSKSFPVAETRTKSGKLNHFIVRSVYELILIKLPSGYASK